MRALVVVLLLCGRAFADEPLDPVALTTAVRADLADPSVDVARSARGLVVSVARRGCRREKLVDDLPASHDAAVTRLVVEAMALARDCKTNPVADRAFIVAQGLHEYRRGARADRLEGALVLLFSGGSWLIAALSDDEVAQGLGVGGGAAAMIGGLLMVTAPGRTTTAIGRFAGFSSIGATYIAIGVDAEYESAYVLGGAMIVSALIGLYEDLSKPVSRAQLAAHYRRLDEPGERERISEAELAAIERDLRGSVDRPRYRLTIPFLVAAVAGVTMALTEDDPDEREFDLNMAIASSAILLIGLFYEDPVRQLDRRIDAAGVRVIAGPTGVGVAGSW